MKKLLVSAAAIASATLLFALIAGPGCQKNEQATPAQPAKPMEKSATKNSFQEVTSQLDPGGSLYVYLSTEQWLAGLSDTISEWRTFLKAIPDLKPQDQQTIARVFDVIVGLIKDSGIEEVSGVGLSSIETDTNFYRTRFVLHHYKGQGAGYLWSMFGKTAHPLNGLDLLPSSTAIAGFSDFDIPLLWSVVDKAISQTGIPEAKDALRKLPDGFASVTGLKLDQVLASLGNEYGLVITLNESNKIALPIPGQAMEIPEPGILLAIKVKDDLIFNRVDELLKDNQAIIKVDKDGVKMRTMPVPLPLPMSVRPTIARSGDYLFIASTDGLITEALSVKAGKTPGLKSTEEFKKLAAGAPPTGNQFSFLSRRFGQIWEDLQTQMMENKRSSNSGEKALLEKLMSLRGAPVQSYSVSANGDEGWVTTGNGNQDAGKILLLPAVAVGGALAAIAVPNFVKAKGTAQLNACRNNLRMIDAAKQQWALENKKTPDATPTWDDLQQYLPGKRPKCPAGGSYQLNKLSDPPTCSVPGHTLD